jgi:hypothetical protein
VSTMLVVVLWCSRYADTDSTAATGPSAAQTQTMDKGAYQARDLSSESNGRRGKEGQGHGQYLLH